MARTGTRRPPHDRLAVALLAALSIVAALALWSPSLREVVLDRDGAGYAVVARTWAAGGLPYRDVFDQKPPVVFLVFRLVFAVAGESLAAVRGTFAVLTAMTGVLVALAFRRLRPAAGWQALVALALAVVYVQGSGATLGGTANTEVPMELAVTIGVLAVLEWRARRRTAWLAAAGVAIGVALLTKPVCLPEAAMLFAVVVATVWRSPNARWRPPLVFAVAGSLPAAGFVGYFWARGALQPAFEAVVVFNLHYVSASPVPLWPRIGFLATAIAKGFAPLLVGAAVLAWLVMRGRRSFAAGFALAWLAAGAIGALSPARPYLHYLQQLAVPLVICAALGAAQLEDSWHGDRRRLRAAWITGAVLLSVPSLALTGAQMRACASMRNWEEQLGKDLDARLDAHERLLVWGSGPEVYWYCHRTPATRFIFKTYITGGSPFAAKARRELLENSLASPPGAIVVLRDDGMTEDPVSSDAEWVEYWAPLFRPILHRYERADAGPCILYLRRR